MSYRKRLERVRIVEQPALLRGRLFLELDAEVDEQPQLVRSIGLVGDAGHDETMVEHVVELGWDVDRRAHGARHRADRVPFGRPPDIPCDEQVDIEHLGRQLDDFIGRIGELASELRDERIARRIRLQGEGTLQPLEVVERPDRRPWREQ